MIFVILGVSILILSFVIALISLVREQKKSVGENMASDEAEHNVRVAGESFANNEKPVDIAPHIEKQEEVKTVSLTGANDTNLNEEVPLPWEQKESRESFSPTNTDLRIGVDKFGESRAAKNENVYPEAESEISPVAESATTFENFSEHEEVVVQKEKYDPSLSSGGVVEVSMKDMIEKSKTGE